jgi:cyclophilin family peptidyl-prolyl cis-trans isomerase
VIRSALAALLLMSVALATPAQSPDTSGLDEGLYAFFTTTNGSFVAKLFEEQAPITVENFVDLATGEKAWRAVDRQALSLQMRARGLPQTMDALSDLIEELPLHEGDPFFSGTGFHRIIDGFMIQGGAPRGIANPGAGGPGYVIPDEFTPALRHDRPGLLSMANSGPNTGGSQFFVTVAPTPHLNDRHAIFGEVVRDYEVVEAISKVETSRGDAPLVPVVIESVEIVRVGPGDDDGAMEESSEETVDDVDHESDADTDAGTADEMSASAPTSAPTQ